MLKNIHQSINIEDIKTEIEKLWHTITNIWNIKQYKTKQPFSIIFLDLKPALNDNDISQRRTYTAIIFESPENKRDIAQCATCHLKPRYDRSADDHLTKKNATVKKALIVSDVCYDTETIPQITRDILSRMN
jgi:hypothetical protein